MLIHVCTQRDHACGTILSTWVCLLILIILWQLMGQYRAYLTHRNANEGNSFLGFHNLALYAGGYGLYMDYSEDYSRYYTIREEIINPDDPNLIDYVYTDFDGDFTKTLDALEVGVLLGVQVDISERIVIDFNIGGGIRKTNLVDTFDDLEIDYGYIENYSVFDIEYTGVKPRLSLMVGFTF